MAQRERKSIAHLADKFNTEAPAGYVAGRGRGISGFSKPPPEPKARGKKRDANKEGDEEGGGADDGREGLNGEAADTRELDLGETEKYEKEEMSMGQQEAGIAMEPFNMKLEREEGHFDDDFNYVWRDTRDDEEHDAWLGEVDEGAESDAKVAKRKELLAKQMVAMQEQEEEAADVPSLCNEAARILLEGESVAAALRRYSAAKAKPIINRTQQKRKRKAADANAAGEEAAPSAGTAAGEAAVSAPVVEGGERARAKESFEKLTDLADKLLRAGRLDVFSETREKLLEVAWSQRAEGATPASHTLQPPHTATPTSSPAHSSPITPGAPTLSTPTPYPPHTHPTPTSRPPTLSTPTPYPPHTHPIPHSYPPRIQPHIPPPYPTPYPTSTLTLR